MAVQKRPRTNIPQYSPIRLELARLASSLLDGTRAMPVLNLPAFESKKYAAYDRFHGNRPYGKIPTKKGPTRTLRFALPYNKYGLLTKCEVKMAGYWPSSFLCVFMDRDEVEVHRLAKKEQGQYPTILTEQTWTIKDLLHGFRGNFSCGIQRVVPSGQDGSILPARVANHSTRFGSSCPLAELAI